MEIERFTAYSVKKKKTTQSNTLLSLLYNLESPISNRKRSNKRFF